MLGALQVSLTYASVRIIFFALFVVCFVLFFRNVLLKKTVFLRLLSLFIAVAAVVCLALLPVENLFFRFRNVNDAYAYMLPKEDALTKAESRDCAAVVFPDKSFVFLHRDERGWQTRLPLSDSAVLRGAVRNIVVSRRDFGGGSGFICVDYINFRNPRYNEGKLLIDQIGDSQGSAFTVFSRVLSFGEDRTGTEYIYCAFADVADPGYKLLINGQEQSIQPLAEEDMEGLLLPKE